MIAPAVAVIGGALAVAAIVALVTWVVYGRT